MKGVIAGLIAGLLLGSVGAYAGHEMLDGPRVVYFNGSLDLGRKYVDVNCSGVLYPGFVTVSGTCHLY